MIKSIEKANLKGGKEVLSWFGCSICTIGLCIWMLALHELLLFGEFVEPLNGDCCGKVLRFQSHPTLYTLFLELHSCSCTIHFYVLTVSLTTGNEECFQANTVEDDLLVAISCAITELPLTWQGNRLKDKENKNAKVTNRQEIVLNYTVFYSL